MQRKRPIIAISVGDPAGIGPEITVKALAQPEIHALVQPLAVCDAHVMRETVRLCGLDLKVNVVSDPAACDDRPGVVNVLDMNNVVWDQLAYGKVAAMTGRASFEYVQKVIELAMAGTVDATVTGPIHKEAIHMAGFHYAGHTEIYGDLTGTRDYAMMLADGNFRVVHVSTHVSLRDAIERVKQPRIRRVIGLAHDVLRQLGIDQPRIAVAGLNPHAGESGLFGREEIDHIIPAIEAARADGINADGPHPPDTIFSKLRGGQYDIVVCMYHDQGHIPTKLIGFSFDHQTNTWSAMSGVNITLGLPIIRVSVDHGVAFDRAGQGTANPQSMVQALNFAAHLVRMTPVPAG